MKLQGRVALVTGASRGIGRGIATAMAKEGASVVVNYNRSEEAARQVVSEIQASGGKAIGVKADVGDYQQDRAMVERAMETFGKVDILVNNAGIFLDEKPVAETDPEEFIEVVNNHLFGSFYCARLVLPYMRQYDRGDIQFISSRNASFMPPLHASYNAAKAAMNALAVSIAKEERYNGIRVNAIGPGLVNTDMIHDWVLNMTDFKTIDEASSIMPLGRMIQPEDIANLCVFLASEEGSHISGEVIYLRGAVGDEPPPYYLRRR